MEELILDDLERHVGRRITHKHLWPSLVLDFCLVQFLIGPCTVCIWKGAWGLYDTLFEMLLGTDARLVGTVCFLIGFFISVIAAVFYREFNQFAQRAGTVQYFLVSRLFSMFSFLASLLYWKGGWDLLDSSQADWLVPHTVVTFCAVVLFIIGSFKSAAITPPLGVSLDTAADYISVATLYGTTEADGLSYRFLDAFCTISIEIISSIAFYGAWGCIKHAVEDPELYPQLSVAVTTLLLAHILSIGLFVVQFIYLRNHFNCNGQCYIQECKDMFYALILILSLFATASFFVGWWTLLDWWVVAEEGSFSHLWSYAASFLFGFFVVISLGTASYNHFGVARERSREQDGILLPFFYLTYYLRDRGMEEDKEELHKTHDTVFEKAIDFLGCSSVFNSDVNN